MRDFSSRYFSMLALQTQKTVFLALSTTETKRIRVTSVWLGFQKRTSGITVTGFKGPVVQPPVSKN